MSESIDFLYWSYYKNRGLSRAVYLKDMLECLERLKYILFRLDTERPSARMCHEWNSARCALGNYLERFSKEYKKASDAKTECKALLELGNIASECELVGKRANCALGNDSYYRRLKDARIVKEDNCLDRDYDTFKYTVRGEK